VPDNWDRWLNDDGLCTENGCKNERSERSQWSCDKHLAQRSEQTKRRRRRRIDNGLCFRCKEPRGENGTGTMCRPCADVVAEQERVRYHYRKNEQEWDLAEV